MTGEHHAYRPSFDRTALSTASLFALSALASIGARRGTRGSTAIYASNDIALRSEPPANAVGLAARGTGNYAGPLIRGG